MRGSGTSGHVQTNKFNLRGPPPPKRDRDQTRGPGERQPNAAILEHNRKREIEVKVELMRDELEDQGLSEEDIELKLAEYRAKLMARAEFNQGGSGKDAPITTAKETHEIALRKAEQMKKLKNALLISDDVKEGDAFNRELQEERKQQRAVQREARRHELEEREGRRASEERRRRRRHEKEVEVRRHGRSSPGPSRRRDASNGAGDADEERNKRRRRRSSSPSFSSSSSSDSSSESESSEEKSRGRKGERRRRDKRRT